MSIGTVTHHVTPTQYIMFRVEPEGSGWEAEEKTLRVFAVDSLNGVDFEKVAALEPGLNLLKVGPFINGSVPTLSIVTRDEEGETVDSWTPSGTIKIENHNSPAVIVRQAAFDILEAADIELPMFGDMEKPLLLADEWGQAASVMEDTPLSAGNMVVEVGAPSTRKRKVTHVRSALECQVPIRIFVIAHSMGQAYNTADNLAWMVQEAIDASTNMNLAGLGVNNFSWHWDVQPPEIVDVEGNATPVVVQDMVITVPMVWAG